MSIILFLIVLAILLLEGWLLTALLLRLPRSLLQLCLSLPFAALANVLLIFLFTIASIPLSLLSLLIGHALIIGLTLLVLRHRPIATHTEQSAKREYWSVGQKILAALSILLLAITILFATVHAVFLPSFAIDAFTNWTMRAKVSYVDQHMAFDTDERRGVAKPQYPFLIHALQITANETQPLWNDHVANTIIFLLTLSLFGACALLLKKLRGSLHTLLTFGSIAAIPIVSIQLGQSYGDLPMTAFLALALVSLAMTLELGEKRWLLLSSLMVAAAMWTKSEGLVFGFLPWALVIGWLVLTHRLPWKIALGILLLPLLLFAPFLLFLKIIGLGFTPHSSDSQIAWHPEGVPMAISSLFGMGSFGILWFALPLMIAGLLILKTDNRRAPLLFPLLAFGGIVFPEVLFVYLCTPNVGFLLNGQSFHRQMLCAALLLLLALSLCFRSQKPESSATLAP